jgi:ArsR family transcriptional regulator, arsenate/arsenite/antimonite-responsive transcriptional repressor
MKPVPQTPIAGMETLFRALADQTRLRILALLASGEVCVCKIHGALGVPQPTASRHLAYLRKTGLVATRRDGLWVHYRLAMPADPTMASVLRTAIGAVGKTRSLTADRKRLSGLTAIPLRVLEDTATCCVAPNPQAVRS